MNSEMQLKVVRKSNLSRNNTRIKMVREMNWIGPLFINAGGWEAYVSYFDGKW